jgi:hypothetical protein
MERKSGLGMAAGKRCVVGDIGLVADSESGRVSGYVGLISPFR